MRRGNQCKCRLNVQVVHLLPQILFSRTDLIMSVLLCEEMDQDTNFEREDDTYFVTSCQLQSLLFTSGLNYL